jgi:hypothetical protein
LFTIAGNNKMENVWDASKLMLLVYGLAAVVSFLVAWIIKLTYVVIRKHGARGRASADDQAQRPAGPDSGA